MVISMTDRLTEAQLQQVVGEAQRLYDRQQAQFDQAEVKAILAELNLPPELLPDAMVQIQRRQALQQQQRRNRWLLGAGAAIVLATIGGGLFIQQQQQQKVNRVGVQQAQISLSADVNDGRAVARTTQPAVHYRVTLNDAPVGEKLSLSCDWIDPSNQVVHQNRYETKTITTPVWATQCRHQIGASAPTGQWQVRMSIGQRSIGNTTFEVK
jgi:hypothetical protein